MFAIAKFGMKGEALSLPPGYDWEGGSADGHVKIICPDGKVLRMPNGIPVVCSKTPSDYRTRKNEWSRIRTALRARGEDV
jgi:hypothetical protein